MWSLIFCDVLVMDWVEVYDQTCIDYRSEFRDWFSLSLFFFREWFLSLWS